MLCYIFGVLSTIGSILLVLGTGIHWLWILPIGIGMYILFQPLFFCILWLSTIFLPQNKPFERPMRGVYGMIWFVCDWFVTMLRIKTEFRGMEKFPEGPFVLVSNHLSLFDPLVVLAKVKGRKIAFISKPSNFKIPVAGAYIHRAGFFAIDRENAMNAMRTLKRAGEVMLQEQMIMGIYPEGTRSKTGELLPFKEGAFLLAKRTKSPIVVMTTRGTGSITKRMILHRSKVALDVIEVIDAQTVQSMRLNELSTHVRASIENALKSE